MLTTLARHSHHQINPHTTHARTQPKLERDQR